MTTDAEPDRPRRPSLIGDPLRTTAVLLVIIGLLAGAQHLLSRPPGDPVRPVDYVPAAEAARETAPFELLAPAELPEGWRATSVRYTGGDEASWHLGMLTDADKYVGLEQAVGPVETLIGVHAPDAIAEGSVEVGGEQWVLLRDGDETTLVRGDEQSSVLVTGDAPEEDIEELAASLTD